MTGACQQFKKFAAALFENNFAILRGLCAYRIRDH